MLISSELPPTPDGIGDYTARLAEQLTANGCRTTVVCSQRDQPPTAIEGANVMACLRSDGWRTLGMLKDLLERLEADCECPDAIVLQYNPFCWGRWGLNPQLARVLRQIKMRRPDVRLGVMFHECFVPKVSWKFRVMRIWQLRQYHALAELADVRFFSIQQWADSERARLPQKPVVHLPVGANLPATSVTREAARAALGLEEDAIVVGVFGGPHPSRLLGHVTAATAAIGRALDGVDVLIVGSIGRTLRRDLEARGVKARIHDLGYLAPDNASEAIAAMDLMLSPFSDGMSTRRGSVMAALQAGVAVLSTSGILTDDLFLAENGRSVAMAPAHSQSEFVELGERLASDRAELARLGQAGRRLFKAEFDWPVVAERMVQSLGLSNNGPSAPIHDATHTAITPL